MRLLVIATILLTAAPAAAQQDASILTRAKYRHQCLLCHASAAPEGVSPEILAGLRPVPGLKPRDVMPNIICQRRCEHCGPGDAPQSR